MLDVSTSVTVAIFTTVDEFLKCCRLIDSSEKVFALHFIYVFWSFFAMLCFESSTRRDKIAPVRLPRVAILSLNK